MSQQPRPKTVKELYCDPDQSLVTIQGWIRSVRRQKKVSFVTLTDGTHIEDLQIVANELPDDCQTGASIHVLGTLHATPQRKQPFELHASSITIIGKCENPATYPIAKTNLSDDYLRQLPHLRIRTKRYMAIMKIRNALARATHTFFQDQDFMYVQTPLITFSDCEGAGEAFQVVSSSDTKENHFFHRPAFLTVSGQLELESYACAMGKTYTFGPTFRAEHSNTSRHLAEFWMIEPEVAFITLDNLQNLAEDYVKWCIHDCVEHCEKEILYLNGSSYLDMLRDILDTPFTRITYTRAIEMLQGYSQQVTWGDDLSSEQEKWLVAECKGPVIVTDYPETMKSFYMKVNDDDKTVACMDILVPGIGELIGGSIREHDYDKLIDRIQTKGLDHEEYKWYTDLRKYGTVPHGGFGLGFERLVMLVTGIKNIKDVIPFPRHYSG